MASSAGIRCGGGAIELKNHHRRLFPNQAAATLPIRTAMCNTDRRSRRLGVSVSASAMAETSGRGIAAENMDTWLRDSVTEIVNNLAEAPLLVQVYADEGKKKLDTEKAVEEGDWKRLIEKWKKRDSPQPDGVIFVEQLNDGGEEAAEAWGVVVQGKGGECGGPACYLLKTSRVGSGVGLGCTHFCLMRVKSFRESAKSQLKNCWLLQPQYGSHWIDDEETIPTRPIKAQTEVERGRKVR